MKNIYVLSHVLFNQRCEENKWTDENVETLNDKAFISIVGTPDVTTALEIDMTEHWFKENHNNVINLNFDDVSEDFMYKGALCKALSDEQAKELVAFIENNIGKEFYIHCLAGISRSRGVAKFIADNYVEYKDSVCDNGYGRPNASVVSKLNHVLWEKHFKTEK